MRTPHLIIVLLACSLPLTAEERGGTANTSPPSSRAAESSAESAKADLQEARSDAATHWRSSADGRLLSTELEARRASLERARAGGTSAERLDASAAFNTVRLKLEQAELAAVEADPQVVGAAAKLSKIQAASKPVEGQITDATQKLIGILKGYGKLNDRSDGGEIRKALKQASEMDRDVRDYLASHVVSEKVASAATLGQPAPGMPIDLLAIFGRYYVVSETESAIDVKFVAYGYCIGGWRLRIEDGKVFSVSKQADNWDRTGMMRKTDPPAGPLQSAPW